MIVGDVDADDIDDFPQVHGGSDIDGEEGLEEGLDFFKGEPYNGTLEE